MLDLRVKVHTGKNVLYIIGKAIQIGLEVVRDVLGISDQRLERERAGVVELISGSLPEKSVLNSQLLYFLNMYRGQPDV